METQELHRGRLLDHVQLVVRNLGASEVFYRAVFDVLGIPMGGSGDGFFWADELVVSRADSAAAQGELTGRVHLAFQALDRATVDAFHRAALAAGGSDNGRPGKRDTTPITTPPSCAIRTATTSRPCTTGVPSAAPPPSTSASDRPPKTGVRVRFSRLSARQARGLRQKTYSDPCFAQARVRETERAP